MKQFFKDFKEFATKGNIIDMSVGVIIGGAFGKIVASLVDDILMPLIGIIVGGIDFTDLSVKVGTATLAYGNFIQQVIDFLIIALCVFLVLKGIMKLKNLKKHEEEAAAEEAPAKEPNTVLLEEIRDLLKNK